MQLWHRMILQSRGSSNLMSRSIFWLQTSRVFWHVGYGQNKTCESSVHWPCPRFWSSRPDVRTVLVSFLSGKSCPVSVCCPDSARIFCPMSIRTDFSRLDSVRSRKKAASCLSVRLVRRVRSSAFAWSSPKLKFSTRPSPRFSDMSKSVCEFEYEVSKKPSPQWCPLISALNRDVKWGASSRWSFGPNSACCSKETMTIGKMQPTLDDDYNNLVK